MKARRQRTTKAEGMVLGYVRVSTEEQTSGVSLAAQESRIAAYASAMDWAISEVVTDAGVSAKSLQRPGMTKILEAVRRGEVERVVVLKLDRCTRSIGDLSYVLDLFTKHGVALVSVGETLDTSTAAGRMVVNMLGVVAQWERETIAERTAGALSHKRRERTVYGPVAFGYRRAGSQLVEDPVERAALAEAVRMDRAGHSFREICRMLEGRQVQPRRAKIWHAASVRAMLRSRIATEAYT